MTYEGHTLTMAKARLIIWNPDAYAANVVRAAAVFILGSLNASREDIGQASLVL
jgi:hypothetical protein